MTARAGRFPLFDSLRAIAALAVLAYHAAFFAGAYSSDSPLRPYAAQANVGVSVFFLISGFLLYRPFLVARFADRPLPAVGAYAWRRFLRIVPAYWVALTVIAIWLSIDDVFTASHGPLYYGFAQIYGARTSVGGIGQAWTLCAEVTFYAFLPLWAWAMRRAGVRGEIVGLACLWLFSLAWKLFALHRVAPSSLDAGPWLMPLPNFLDQFAVGMALALASVRVSSVPAVERRPWLPWLGALVAFWALSTQIGLHGRLGETVTDRAFLARHELSTLVALGLLLPAIWGWQRRDAVHRVLGWRPLLYVGLVSYGVYLWHYAVIFKTATAINHWLTRTLGLGVELRFLVYFVLGTLGAVAIATVSYRLVERPALSLKRLVGPPPDERRDEPIAKPAPITLRSG